MELDVKVIAAAFVFVGAVTFYVSSLISGHNIYKDFQQALTALTTSVIGFLLFALSPICLILLAADDTKHVSTSTLAHLFDAKVFMPFICNSVGLGIVVGCMSLIKARKTLFELLRDKSGMKYTIYSYDTGWDNLLAKVKPEGVVELILDNGTTIAGKLLSHSVKQEPKQIVLRDYVISGSGDCNKNVYNPAGKMLITEASQVLRVIVPQESFNRHFDSMNHSTQAFYLLITYIGLAMLSWGLHTSWDNMSHYKSIASQDANINLLIYYRALVKQMALACFTASLIVYFTSVNISWRDYNKRGCAILLTKYANLALLIVFGFVLGFSYHLALDYEAGSGSNIPFIIMLIKAAGIVAIILWAYIEINKESFVF